MNREISDLNCRDRKDLILLDAADALEPAEQAELRRHLATGCPQCAGYLAEAEAMLGQLTAAGGSMPPPSTARNRLMRRVRAPKPTWEKWIVPSSIAAVLAVGITLAAVATFFKPHNNSPAVAGMQQIIAAQNVSISTLTSQLEDARRGINDMKFAQLTGNAQPQALGRVFIDLKDAKWYFFTSGMKPAAPGKTYELWLISDNQKIPAGTFAVSADGTATLLGSVPPLKPGAAVTLCVTDEPAGGVQSPTGSAQIQGDVD
jgi:anti-sigma-K factor RskA